ncbi:hypothetical protein Tco_1352810 [Tanacetum coccineum]
MCGRMFLEESDEVEKYVGGLPDMIQGSAMASKQKTMQDAIEFATELMDQKIRTFTDRQAENKRKLDDNSRNNQTQQQPFKRQNVARAYIARPDEKKLDTAYWEDPIRRIRYDSASTIVEIDLTWSLGLVLVELGKLLNPLSCRTLLICPIWISKVLIDAPWFLMASSIKAQISLIKLEFSLCLFADSLINLLMVSSIDYLCSWYEGFVLFL